MDLRLDLAPCGRALVEQKHNINKVIGQYVAFYERLFRQPPTANRQPPTTPTGFGDVAYIKMQVELTEQNERFWPRWRARYRRVMDRTRDLHAFGANGRPTGKLAQSIAVGRAVVR